MQNSFKDSLVRNDPDTDIVDVNYGINSMQRYEYLLNMAKHEDDFVRNEIRKSALKDKGDDEAIAKIQEEQEEINANFVIERIKYDDIMERLRGNHSDGFDNG